MSVVIAAVDVAVTEYAVGSLPLGNIEALHLYHGIWQHGGVPVGGIGKALVNTDIVADGKIIVALHVSIQQMVCHKSIQRVDGVCEVVEGVLWFVDVVGVHLIVDAASKVVKSTQVGHVVIILQNLVWHKEGCEAIEVLVWWVCHLVDRATRHVLDFLLIVLRVIVVVLVCLQLLHELGSLKCLHIDADPGVFLYK